MLQSILQAGSRHVWARAAALDTDTGSHKVDSHNIPDMEDKVHTDWAGTARLDSCHNHHRGMLHSSGMEALDTQPLAAAWAAAVAAREEETLVDNMVPLVALHAVPRHVPGTSALDTALYRAYPARREGMVRVLAVLPHYLIREPRLFPSGGDLALHRGLAMAPYIHSPQSQAFS